MLIAMLRALADHLDNGGTLWDEECDDLLRDYCVSRADRRALTNLLAANR